MRVRVCALLYGRKEVLLVPAAVLTPSLPTGMQAILPYGPPRSTTANWLRIAPTRAIGPRALSLARCYDVDVLVKNRAHHLCLARIVTQTLPALHAASDVSPTLSLKSAANVNIEHRNPEVRDCRLIALFPYPGDPSIIKPRQHPHRSAAMQRCPEHHVVEPSITDAIARVFVITRLHCVKYLQGRQTDRRGLARRQRR